MERTVVIWHHSAWAYYKLVPESEGTYKARLAKYNGIPENRPVEEFSLYKEGRRWISSIPDLEEDLLEQIGYDIELRQKEQEVTNLRYTNEHKGNIT